MATLKIKKVNVLPGTLEANTLYFVKGSDSTHVDAYLSSDDGLSVRHFITAAEVDSKIAAAGGGGSGGATTVFPAVTSRYEALSSVGYKVHCRSSAPLHTGISWSRSGTTMTINDVGHGRSVNERAIIKDTNVPLFAANITNVTADTYTVTCTDSGATSGVSGQYSMGFRYAHNSEAAGALTGGELFAPAGVDIQLQALRMHTPTNSRAGATYDMVLPVSDYNSAIGPNLTKDEIFLPSHQIRADTDVLTAVANTIAMNQASGGYRTLRFGALGSVTQGQLMILQF